VLASAIPEAPAQTWLTRLAHGTIAAGFTAYLMIVAALVASAPWRSRR
jgi:hypothetical protein